MIMSDQKGSLIGDGEKGEKVALVTGRDGGGTPFPVEA